MKKIFIVRPLNPESSFYNRQFMNVSIEKFGEEITREDDVFLCENGNIQTLWKLSKIVKQKYRFEKIKVIKEGCKYSELDISKTTDKTTKIIRIQKEEDIKYLKSVFEHNIKIYPQYNITSILDKDLELLKKLKSCDPKLEFYYNVITDNRQKASVAIIPTYGVCIIENFEINTLGGIDSNTDNLYSQLLKNTNLYKDISLADMETSLGLNENNVLNFEYMKYCLCNGLTTEQINQVNMILEEKNHYMRFVTLEQLMDDLIAKASGTEIVVDNLKEYGIKCALMPQYVIRKSATVFERFNDEVLKMPSSSILLDDEQIRILDELDEKTCIESTAGTGKSAILLTKAYMMAKANPEKQFLLICYNRQLYKELERQSKYKRQQIANLQISSFDKFVKDNYSNTNNFDENHKVFLNKIREGNIAKHYGGIFIDEMQQLKEEWKLALYEHLDSNKYMIMVGDNNQAIRIKSEEEYAQDDDILERDEEGNDVGSYYLGDIRFKKIVLNKNYRNTIQITDGINRLIKAIDKYREKYNIYVSENSSLLGISVNEGETPEYIRVTNREQLRETIMDKITYLLNEKGLQQEDIILLYPPNYGKDENSKTYTYGKIGKTKMYEIRDMLNVEFNDLTKEDANNPGIKLCTIGKAIGLDFKAVIIFGLCNITAFDEQVLRTANIRTKKKIIEDMRNIYVAASRAKEYLYIIDDTDVNDNNIISKYVKKIGD